jgi:PKD repeat protein
VPAPSHSYVAPGTYTVSLTVTDSVGNKTTRTATTTVSQAGAPPPPPVSQKPPAITLFELKDPKIQGLSRVAADAPDKTTLKVRLTSAADVRIVLRSKHRHLVDGKHRRVQVTLTRRLPAGRSSITLKGRLATIKLLPDTYRIVGAATNPAGTSPARRARLVVVRPSSASRIGDPR